MYQRVIAENVTRAAWLLLLALFIGACDMSGLDNINEKKYGLLIELEEIDTPVLVTIYDAATGKQVKESVTLTISGQDAAAVIDAYSDPATSFKLNDGRLSFGIQNGVTPSEASPVRFTIHAEAQGYLATSQNVKITEVGDLAVDLHMIRPSQPPQGTAVQQDHSAQASSTGATTAPVTVSTAPEAETQASASATVAEGTTFSTATGTTLTGQLTTTLTYFNNISEGSLQSLPGATNALAVTESGTSQALLRPAGAASLQVEDAQSRVAASADRAIDLFIEINPETVNPTTRAPYQEGESIGLWSFDKTLGAWQKRGTATLTTGASGRLGVHAEGGVGKVQGGSSVGGAVVAGAVIVENSDDSSESVTTCEPTFTFSRNGNTGLLPVKITGSATFSKTLKDDVSTWAPGSFLDTDVIDIKVYRPEGKQVFSGVNPCSGNTSYDLAAASGDVITLDAEATLSCQDPDKQIIVSDGDFQVTYERLGGAQDDYVSILIPKSKVNKLFDNNRLSGLTLTLHGLVNGAQYAFAGTALDVNIEHEETAAETLSFDFEIDDNDICQ